MLQHIGEIAGMIAVAVVHAMAIASGARFVLQLRDNMGDRMATHELHSSPETCHWGYFDSQLKP